LNAAGRCSADTTSELLSLTPAQRRRGLAAAIAAVTVFGLSIGQGGPLLPLILESRGTDVTVNGLNAAATFVGVILGPLLAPRCARRLGIRDFLLACFVLDMAVFALMKPFDSIATWFALRFLLGVIGSSIFTVSEASINLLADDATRGRIIGVYAAALSAGFALGPLLLSATGIHGWAPFLVNIAITAMATLPLLGAGDLGHDLGREPVASVLGAFTAVPFILFAVAVFGLYETTLMTLVPIWGVRMGLTARLAAATVSAAYLGAIALQFPIGWLSDKMARPTVLRLCGMAGCGGAVLLSIVATSPPPPVRLLFVLLFLWGGIASGIYPVVLGMAGDRFRGNELVSVNAAIIMAYGLGALFGPPLGGAAMDIWNSPGLLGFFVVLFAGFLLATLLAGREHDVGDAGPWRGRE
jgi:MFS family permease